MAGITPEGFVPKTQPEIEADIKGRLTANVSPNLDLSEVSIDGQNVAIFANHMAQLWEAAADIDSDKDPDQASITGLVGASKITGTRRLAAAPTTVTCYCALAAGTYTAGTLIIRKLGDDSVRFSNISTVVAPGASIFVDFQCLVTGPVVLPATSVEIAVPVAGFTAVTNLTAGVTGRNEETYEELQLRREESLAKKGSCTVDAIRADLLAVPTVTYAEVFENVNPTADGNGTPGHGIQCVVVGGSDAEVAQTIWDSKDPGTPTGGTGATSANAADYSGRLHAVYFVRPAAVPMYFDIQVQVLSGYETQIVQRVKDAIVAFITGRPGKDVLYAKAVATVVGLEGVIDANHVWMDDVVTPTGVDVVNVVINYNQYATVLAANIAVTYVVVAEEP